MSFFNKKYLLDPLQDKSKHDRRNFMAKSFAALFGVTILTKAEDLLAMKSKTGLIYVKQNGEVINNFKPSSGDLPYLSEIGLFSFNFAPRYWAQCNGQLLSISQNTALFSLLGTTFGGNGTTNFALPDLRGRSPIHFGQGPGLSQYVLGQAAGSEAVTLLQNNLPAHSHVLTGNSGVGSTYDPTNNYISQYGEGVKSFSGSVNTTMNQGSITNTGGNQPHNNLQPYLTLNYCIALQGVFPSQS